MLHDFLLVHRDEIITRTREKLTDRPWPLARTSDLRHGVSIFLTQLAEVLRTDTSQPTPLADAEIAASATLHGRDLRALGFNVSQVVHDYGDVCQAVTEMVVDHGATVSPREFLVLNRCLDLAIAEAVTEHARITAEARTTEEIERSGRLAHETRDLLGTAVFAFEAIQRGSVAANGSTGAVLGRTLMSLTDLVASTLAEIRMTGNHPRRERVSAADILAHVASAAHLHAGYRGVRFSAEPCAATLELDVDPQLLESAIMNLLNNGFKYTRLGGQVKLRASEHDGRLRIEVEDECGGIPDGSDDLFQPFTERRGQDRSGLGLGLSIARRAVAAHEGHIHVRNMPGCGCVFVVDLPLASSASGVSSSRRFTTPGSPA
jgi:signal transduction histidine kinase